MDEIIYTKKDLYDAEGAAGLYDDWDFLRLFEMILERAIETYNESDEPYEEDSIVQAIDEGLIYISDQWTVLEYYSSPEDADYDEAIEFLTGDLFTAFDYIINKNMEGKK